MITAVVYGVVLPALRNSRMPECVTAVLACPHHGCGAARFAAARASARVRAGG
ncbi:hypothetical protein [Streptomyces sp. NPDC054794]